jgi:hypothetical protein
MVAFLPLLLGIIQFAFGAYEMDRRSVFLMLLAVSSMQLRLALMGVMLLPEMRMGI